MSTISVSMFVKAGWSLPVALIGCVVAGCSGSRAADDRPETGEMRAALTADVLGDVAAVAYTVVDVDEECDGEAIAEATSPIEGEALPLNLQPDGGGDNHAFADALFVLDPGSYRV